MAHDSYISSTSFRLVSDESEDAIRALIQEHMDDYQVDLSFTEPHADGDKFSLESENAEVGDSFNERVHNLVQAMAPHVQDFFAVTIRNDSMSDDRDDMAYGGPSPEMIREGIAKLVVDETLDTLKNNPRAMALLRERLLADKNVVHLADVRLVAEISGGVLQNITSTHDVAVTSVDYDTEGCDDDQLVDVPANGVGPDDQAIGGRMALTIDPARVAVIEKIFEDQTAEVQRISRSHPSN
jgi:hypothetical protein